VISPVGSPPWRGIFYLRVKNYSSPVIQISLAGLSVIFSGEGLTITTGSRAGAAMIHADLPAGRRAKGHPLTLVLTLIGVS